MAGFRVDLGDVQDFGALNTFPDGVYAARIDEAKFDVNGAGNLSLNMKLELFSETLGTARCTWNISSAAKFMLKPFWIAINDLTPEEFAANPEADIEDPERLVGTELLVQLGTKGWTDSKTGEARTSKNIVAPFAYPLSRYQELADLNLVK